MVPLYSVKISRVPTYSKIILFFTCTGLSPTLVRLSRRFQLLQNDHWADPRSLATTSGISVDFFSSGYLDVSVPLVRLLHLWIQYKIPGLCRVGSPIQRSLDHSLFADSPKLFAGYHVFHRLWLPRHPPCTLSHLTIQPQNVWSYRCDKVHK